MLYPVDATSRNPFSPFQFEPPTSFSHDFPPDFDISCLLLGCGDPRGLLFTIFGDMGPDSPSRKYDFTCCDVEPAILARNILLLTLLMDGYDEETFDDIWSSFFDLYIPPSTLQLIRKQSERLAQLSGTIHSWNSSPYAQHLHVANFDTLSLLSHFWTKYSSPNTPYENSYRASIKEIYRKEYEGKGSLALHRATGPRTLSLSLFRQGNTFNAYEQYWKHGTYSHDPTSCNNCNPLFAYSSAGGETFSVRKDTLPLLGFHLAPAFVEIDPSSPYFVGTAIEDQDLIKAVKMAKWQFRAWSDAFRRAVETSKIQLRFICSDAISLLIALNKNQETLGEITNRYSRPGSSNPLILDHYNGPESFDVVDTSYLVDTIGFHNLAPYIIPLFSSHSSVLYTNTSLQPNIDEKFVLSTVLSTPIQSIPIICTLYGLAPTCYLAGLTPQAHEQNSLHYAAILGVQGSGHRYVIYRLTWRPIPSLDSNASATTSPPGIMETTVGSPNASAILTSTSTEEMSKFLTSIFVRMFSNRIMNHKIPIGPPTYTIASFATLLRFLTSRIQVNWDELIRSFLQGLRSQPGHQSFWLELGMYLYLFGMEAPGENSMIIDFETVYLAKPNPNADLVRAGGVLARKRVPQVVAMVWKVPRGTLLSVYEAGIKGIYNEALCIRFWIHVSWGSNQPFQHTFLVVQTVFGKLRVNDDKETATIEEDMRGWQGEEDLLLCTYFPTHLLYRTDIKDAIMTLRLSKEESTLRLLSPKLGPNLEVWGTPVVSDRVTFLASLPGLKVPEPRFERRNVQGDVAMDISLKSFKRRITLERDSEKHRSLLGGAEIKIQQSSPCSILVKYSTFEQTIGFPFPIVGDSARLRVSRTNAWMEIMAPLIDKSTHIPTPFPLSLPNSLIRTWNMPYINVRQLPQLSHRELGPGLWKLGHLPSMFSDREIPLRIKKMDLMTSIKNSIHAILTPFGRAIRLKCGKESISFYQIEQFLDLNSQSLIALAWVWENVVVRDLERTEITITAAELKWWRENLPAMAERFHHYPHLGGCEYLSGKRISSLCSCGKGTIEIMPSARPVIIAPIFAIPYLEDTRGLYEYILTELPKDDADPERMQRFLGMMEPVTDEVVKEMGRTKCVVCLRASVKKCGRCDVVSYCSRECQARDWKSHKSDCKAVAK